MEEIAHQFRNELQALLNRYKNRLTTPQIMRIAQPIFTKTIGIKDNQERFMCTGDTLKNPEPVKGDWVVSDKEPL